MSLSTETKAEISRRELSDCCAVSALSALIHCAGSIGFSSGGLSVSLDTVGSHALSFVQKTVKRLHGGSAVREGGVIVIRGGFILDMLKRLAILYEDNGIKVEEGISPRLIARDCCKSAYLMGAFLGSGSLATKSYHLQISCLSKKLHLDLIELLNSYGIRAASSSRGSDYIANVKGSEGTCDALAAMGASGMCLRLNKMFIERNFRQTAARAANCDMANLARLVSASVSQVQAIEKLGEIKNPKLKQTAEARVMHPDYNYDELAHLLKISKGSVKYRLNKIMQAAAEMEESD